MTRVLERALALGRMAVRRPSGLIALARWRPFSITAFEMAHALREQGVHPRTVIDGGANVGQFARACLEVFSGARVISFEPLPEAIHAFRRHFEHESRCRLVEAALGETLGVTAFHPQEYALASSVLLPVHGTARAAIQVPVTPLDQAIAAEELEAPVLLKLDLQGYELAALRGARASLRRIRWVLLEVVFRPSYVAEATFEDLYDFLREHGFRFLRPVDTLVGDGGEVIQMDALFENARS